MDREALVLYLENVRDLEVIRDRINRLWNYEKDRYQLDCNTHFTEVSKPKERVVNNTSLIILGIGTLITAIIALRCILFVLSCILGRDVGIYGGDLFWPFVGNVLIGIIAILGFLTLFFSLLEVRYSKKSDEKYNFDNAEQYKKDLITAQKNKQYLAQREKEWSNTANYYKSEYSKVKELLSKFYAMNIIPVQYRKISAVCYLYDYMSSSQESYQMALLSNQIEDGIRRIEAKLDEIVYRLDEIIWQQKVIREENRQFINRQINQNNQMIDRLKRMETSQRNIEEYSRLSANYNEAQAFISMAYYMKHR